MTTGAWKLTAIIASGTALFLAIHPISQSGGSAGGGGGGGARTGGGAARAPLPDSDRETLVSQLRTVRTASQGCEILERLGNEIGTEPLLALLDRTRLPELRHCAVDALARLDDPAALARLEQFASDSDSELRDKALRGLAKSEDRNARATVLEIAMHGPTSQRHGALLALAASGRPEATELMMRSVETAEGPEQIALATALGGSHDPATVPTLTRLVASSRDDVSVAAIRALGQIGDEASIAVLKATLNDAHGYHAIRGAASALASIEDPRAQAALLHAANNPNNLIAQTALNALHTFDGPEVHALMLGKIGATDASTAAAACAYFQAHPDASVTPRLLEVARHAGNRAASEALEALEKAPGFDIKALLVELAAQPGSAQYTAIRSLTDQPGGTELARPILLRLLADGGDGAALAAQALSSDGSPVAQRALIGVLHSGGRAVSTAAMVLSRSHDPEAMKALEDLALSGTRKADREIAISALSMSRDPNSNDVLQRLVGDPDPTVHQQALSALLELGGPKAEALAISSSSSKDKQDRLLSVSGLISSASPASVDRLQALASDPDKAVARQALDGLLDLDPTRGSARLHEMMQGNVESRRSAIESIDNLQGDAARPILLDAMRDSDSQVVVDATEALARIGGHEAQEAIGEVLRSTTSSKEVKKAAADALANMGASSGTYRDLIERYRTVDEDEPDDEG